MRKVSYILLILWMVVIFNLSSQPAQQSDELSSEVTKVIRSNY